MRKLIRKLIFIFPILKIFHNKLGRNKISIDKNNKIDINKALLRGSFVEMKGNNNYLRVGKESKVYNCSINISGDNNFIDIGNNVSIIEADIKLWGNGNKLEIGDFTTFNVDCKMKVFEGTEIIIGKDCMISYSVDMRSSDGHPIFDEDGTRINNAKAINIGDHVWIGSYVNILKGTTILKNSIVGTGSLINKAQKLPNSIIVGRPAEIQRSNVTWKRKI